MPPLTTEFSIRPGEKYALVAMQTIVPLPTESLTTRLTERLWAAYRFPIRLEEHWKDWIGSVRVGFLESANLVLVATTPSSNINVEDHENDEVSREASLLYQCVLLAGTIKVFGQPVILTGSNRDNRIDVRKMSEIPPPCFPLGIDADRVTQQVVAKASALRTAIRDLEAARAFKRFFRILNIHYNALLNRSPTERLHQFCRCLEGFILPDIGKTTKQFRTRTELFVGQGHRNFMERLYAMRGLIEHLHRVHFPDWPASERDQRLIVSRAAVVAEALSRYCICQFLVNRALRNHFVDDAALTTFWGMKAAERQKIWGDPADLNSIQTSFDPNRVSDRELDL